MARPKPLDVEDCTILVKSARWESKVSIDADGCHRWHGKLSPTGYGDVSLSGRMVKAHRVAWVAANGRDIPSGLTIDHVCRTRSCVNPDHLEPLSIRDNTLRGSGFPAQQLLKTHCPEGHPLSEENLAPWRLPRRICLACQREKGRSRYAAKKGAR